MQSGPDPPAATGDRPMRAREPCAHARRCADADPEDDHALATMAVDDRPTQARLERRGHVACHADDEEDPDDEDDDPDASNAAVTAVTGPTASVHVAALEHALRHPAKCDPGSGVAVRVWRAPKSRRTVQLPPQSIEPPWTRPEPLPALRMWKRTVMVGGTWAMSGCWPSKPIAAQRARSAVIPQVLPAPKSQGRYHAGGSCGESGLVSAAARLTSVPMGKSAEHSVSTSGSPSP